MSSRKKLSNSKPTKDNYDQLLSGISRLAERFHAINKQAVEQYTPVVKDIIDSNCRDVKYIERTLDKLLGFCGYEPAVKIYRKLCRYYLRIDQQGAAYYAKSYIEMWEQ